MITKTDAIFKYIINIDCYHLGAMFQRWETTTISESQLLNDNILKKLLFPPSSIHFIICQPHLVG